MKNIKIILTSLFLILPSFNNVLAANIPLDKLENLRPLSGFASTQGNETSLATNIGIGVKAFLSILGIIFVILIMYAGYKWMMAQGDKGEVDKAKSILNRAIIGLIIIIGSYAIWGLILVKLFK